MVAAAARRRYSGDVVTADFFQGLVRACPGQPVKLSGRYSISSPLRPVVRPPWRMAARCDGPRCGRLPHATWWRRPHGGDTPAMS
ncbi:hypothetical protein F511_44152 [Dorcoceras hygrometricum]|uniref:Uncharacterized protein n=1 Tax=Dorcoceras hygrometricum TaxID=472368 RepID=A0A2Z7BEB3_9LAMI|nr:hypothetical protein F511_44152 [Dorcoceras hygrometricum]